MNCPDCGTSVVWGVDQFEDSQICPKCIKVVPYAPRRIFGSMNANAVKNIKAMTDEQIIAELRLPPRATLGPEAYTLYFAEVLARLLERGGGNA